MEPKPAYSSCYGTSPQRTGLPRVGYHRGVARYIFRPMPPWVATWSFWIAVCACAAGQVAILRDTVGPRGTPDARSGTEVEEPGSLAPPPRLAWGRLHAAGEVLWAVLPGVALAFVLLWTWDVMHADRRVTPHPALSAAPRSIAAQ